MKFYFVVKRLFDIFFSMLGLGMLAPLFLVVAVLVKIDSPGPVFFRYERIGKNGKPFYPFKFRTMKPNAINEGLGYNVSAHDDRITKLGQFLRTWGIDEFPQLINVLKGEMSLVGPRPTFRYQTEKYNEFEAKRLSVKPGIVGWALIHGRNSLSWKERIAYDVWYASHQSFWLDVKIILISFYVILIKRRGVYGKGGINDDPFSNHDKSSNF